MHIIVDLNKLKEYIEDNAPVCLYGAGNVSRKLIRIISSEIEKNAIDGVFVSDAQHSPNSIENIPVE